MKKLRIHLNTDFLWNGSMMALKRAEQLIILTAIKPIRISKLAIPLYTEK